MRNCDACGGSVKFVNGHIAKCEYCGRIFQVNGDNLSEVNMESLYKEALGLLKKDSEEDTLSAVEIFDALGSYKDSSNKAFEGKNKIAKARADEADRKLEEKRQNELAEIERKKREFEEKPKKKIIITIGAVAIAVIAIILTTISISNSKKNDKYQQAVAYLNQGEYEEAVELFESLGDYKDSADFLRSANESIAIREDAYNKGVSYYNEGLYSEAISALTEIAGYLDSNEYIENAAGKLYEQGEQFFNGEEYEKAKAVLGSIPETSGSYTKAVALLKQVDERIVEIQNIQKYEAAVSAYEGGEYETAQRLFIEIREYSDSKEYLNTIGDSLFEMATSLYDTGDYVSCGDYLVLIDSSDEWGRYSEAVDLFNKAKEIYYNQIEEEAKTICRSQGETEMRSYIDSMNCNLLSDSDIQELKSDSTIEVMYLSDMEPYYKAHKDHIREERGFEDLTGNVYDYAIVSYIDDYGYDYEWVYSLDGKYTQFVADIIVENNPGGHSSGSVRIIGDGRTLFSKENIDPTTKSYTIEVDVTGVTDLSITVNGDYSSCTAYGLGNPRVIE